MTEPWFQLPSPAQCGWNSTSHNAGHNAGHDAGHDADKNGTAIIGAGIAGLCVARALLKQGMPVTVYEAASHCAAGASASPAGIIKPYVTRQPSDAMRFYTEAYKTLFRWLPELEKNGGLVSCGALQLIDRSFPDNPTIYDCLDAAASSELAGVTLSQSALKFKQSGWLSVHTLCNALLSDVQKLGGKFVTEHRLQTLRFNANGNAGGNANTNSDSGIDKNTGDWELTFDTDQGSVSHLHATVVLASGAALTNNEFLSSPALIPARGQLTEFPRSFSLNTVVCGKQYAIPTTSETLWVGATFDRENDDASWQPQDDARNETSANELMPHLEKPIESPLNHFAAVRATTIDRLPILGPVPNAASALSLYHDLHHGRPAAQYSEPNFHKGLAVVGGLGSRGIALAPFAAELFADWLSGGAALQHQNRLISPLRFLIRQLKRQ